eukprot:g2699.t1
MRRTWGVHDAPLDFLMNFDLSLTPGETDRVLLLPPAHLALYPLTTRTRRRLQGAKVKVIEVPWIEPPGVSPTVAQRNQENHFGNREYIRLHAMNLDYDVVVYLDTDVRIVGDLNPIFEEGQDLFVSTGSTVAPLDGGFFAVRPSGALFRAMLDVLRTVFLIFFWAATDFRAITVTITCPKTRAVFSFKEEVFEASRSWIASSGFGNTWCRPPWAERAPPPPAPQRLGRRGQVPEIAAVTAALRDGWLAPGPRTDEFEAKVSELFGDPTAEVRREVGHMRKRFGVMVNSGSSGNIIGLAALGLQRGDEVITPACTFATCIAPMEQLGLTPVFIDVIPNRYVPSVEPWEQKCSVSVMFWALDGLRQPRVSTAGSWQMQ